MKFIVVLCSLLCCAPAAMGQTNPQNQIPAAVETSNGKLPILAPIQFPFIFSLPPVLSLPPQADTAIDLPSLPATCGGRLDTLSISAGPMKLTAAAGLKGQTTGDPKYDALIIASAVRNKIDAALLFSVMKQESSFNARAVSHKGAGGLMQLMPDTAARFGVRNIFNPAQNIEAGARYLRFLLDTFGGDVSLALAAYNAGEGNVRKYGGSIPPYPETKKYVSKIRQRYEGLCAPPQSPIS